jgi:glycosyltransferase involved in cell wall biosynthesis
MRHARRVVCGDRSERPVLAEYPVLARVVARAGRLTGPDRDILSCPASCEPKTRRAQEGGAAMSELRGVSVIVVNYNNERFLAAAIDSALAQDHPHCEVIVVDDCSTDNSRGIIERYATRIRSVLRDANGHQLAALNSAWPLARYPILIFLDSDDLLFPHAAKTIANVWTAATVKAQFPLASIDEAGRPMGHVAPKYPPNLETATLRAQLLHVGQSQSSPGSGNAYSRSLLEQVARDGGFDLGNLRDYWMDNILECNAPFYGEVVTIYEPLACYRKHESNLVSLNAIDHVRFEKWAHTCTLKLDYLAHRCRCWGIEFDIAAVRDRSLHLLESRLAAARLAPAGVPHEPVGDTLRRALWACCTTPGPLFPRLVLAAWFTGVAVTPRALAVWLITLRFVAGGRPAWFERLLTSVMKPASKHKTPKERPIVS